MPFSNQIDLTVILPSKWWQKPLYQLKKPVYCAGFLVPAGFISDGASVPRIFWPIFPPLGRYFKAALVHDYLLINGVARKPADQIFKLALHELDIKPWRVNTLYLAVRSWGILSQLSKSFKPPT